jgi:hypothetical protein
MRFLPYTHGAISCSVDGCRGGTGVCACCCRPRFEVLFRLKWCIAAITNVASDWLSRLLLVAGAGKWDAMPHEDGWLLSVWKETAGRQEVCHLPVELLTL